MWPYKWILSIPTMKNDIRAKEIPSTMQTALTSTLPAEWNLLCKQGVFWLCPSLELADVEVWEGVIDEAMHGSILAVCILIHKAWDEIGGDSNDKSLRDGKTNKQKTTKKETTASWICVSRLSNSGENFHVQVNLEWWWRELYGQNWFRMKEELYCENW